MRLGCFQVRRTRETNVVELPLSLAKGKAQEKCVVELSPWGILKEVAMFKYKCTVCGYVYDQKRGEPHRGIKAGTAFEDLPDDYVCPVCALDPKIKVQFGKVFKSGFEPLEI